MKMYFTMLLGLILALPAFSEDEIVGSLAGKLKQIVDGKVEDYEKWDVRFMYNYNLHDFSVERIYTGDSTLEERSKDEKLMRDYVLVLDSSREFRRLVNGVLAHSETQKTEQGNVKPLIDALAGAKRREVTWEYGYIGGCISGVMLGFFQGNILQYFVVFAPDNSEELDILVGRLKYLVIAKLNYTEKGLVKDFEFELRERNDDLNKEIKRVWDSLNLGIWRRSDRPYALMPMGMKDNMYSIEEFAVVTLKAQVDGMKKTSQKMFAEPIEKYEKAKQEGALFSDEYEAKMVELKRHYHEVRLPYEKEVEAKLKYYEERQKKKREGGKERKTREHN